MTFADLPKSTETTSISIPTWLIELVDEYAVRSDLTRSAFIARSIRKYLLLKYDSPKLWTILYQKHVEASCEEL